MSHTATFRARLLTLVETANELKVSTKTVRRWIERRDLRAHQLGRQLRVAEDDLQAFLATRRV